MQKFGFLFTRPLKIFFYKTAQQNCLILHTNSPLVCVIKFYLNSCATSFSARKFFKEKHNARFICSRLSCTPIFKIHIFPLFEIIQTRTFFIYVFYLCPCPVNIHCVSLTARHIQCSL